MADRTNRRKALDEAIDGKKARRKRVALSGKKNRVSARIKSERINPAFARQIRGQTTDSNNE